MENRIVEFAHLLRASGVRVSIPEELDALRALELVGIEDPTSFRHALRTTLIKQSIDQATFDDLFDAFFLGLSPFAKALENQWAKELNLDAGGLERFLDVIRELLDRWEETLSALTLAVLTGDIAQVERLIRAADSEKGKRSDREGMAGAVYSDLAARLDMERVRAEMDAFKSFAAGLRLTDELFERVSRYADWRLEALSQLLREFIRRDTQKKQSLDSQRRPEAFLEKSFVAYTEEDTQLMQRAVARLARKFKNRVSLRRRRERKGRLDIKRTLRSSLPYGGVPFHMRLERKRKEKPQIVVLCDISDSVLHASRFMLHFVYSVQELYHKVRSFVFVSDIEEVTKVFEDHGLATAVEKALKGDVIDVFAHSNFGRAFEIFHKKHLRLVTPKTTVIVMGDGRNNYHRPNDWALREIREKAKQVIWLNPESRLTWGYGDSEIFRYSSHCNQVEECRSIRQLYDVMDRIAP